MKILAAQLNPIIGNFSYNSEKIKDAIINAAKQNCDLLVFSECFVSGYPAKDLFESQRFLDHVKSSVETISLLTKEYKHLTLVLGAPWLKNDKSKPINAAIIIREGSIIGIQAKSLLPNYDVFDEKRYFDTDQDSTVFDVSGVKCSIVICEDAWFSQQHSHHSFSDPVADRKRQGAELIINIMASPFELDKHHQRLTIMKDHVKQHNIPMLCVNQIGGQDELVFDGGSFYISNTSLLQGRFFTESYLFIDTERESMEITQLEETKIVTSDFNQNERLYHALVLGLRDYVKKCGFSSVHLGLSGGIDSAVTAVIAVDALGKENVIGFAMPSPYSSQGSLDDAKALATNLGITYHELPISESYELIKGNLNDVFHSLDKHNIETDITFQNIQSRIRGLFMMGVSNATGSLLLSTGNKSEMAVGYCTLYGDMNGGLCVLGDVYKTQVFELAKYINQDEERVPMNTITKPPSAELKPDQKDEDSLPPYELLDAILMDLIEGNLTYSQLEHKAYPEEVLNWVYKSLVRNEYKRQQSSPTIKCSFKAFGFGRRFPITAQLSL